MITYEIITTKGSVSKEAETETAMKDIKEYIDLHRAWLYLDGLSTNLKDLTKEQLESAGLVVITHAILGG